MAETFTKAERLCSQKLIDQLFAGGNASIAAFPLRAIYRLSLREETDAVPVAVLMSVPKKRLHHAVDRNRMKRQMREAYRHNKQSLWERLEAKGKRMEIAFICIADEPCESSRVTSSMQKILRRIEEATD
ncbi:MAG: ribonuclease P protein component [Bacteroidaceae bacterium]|jgi:ribonuclease P protein component|nr:ribonuclease P protein component [Bacteroidaceae bacterium]